MRTEHKIATDYLFKIYLPLSGAQVSADATEKLLVSIGLDHFLEGSNLLGNLGVLHAGSPGLGHLQLALVESLALHLPLSLKSGNNVLVLPANLKDHG